MRSELVHIDNGLIKNRQDAKNLFAGLTGDYIITVEPASKVRSIQQNKYYWKCVVPLIRKGLFDKGWEDIRTNMAAHNWLKETFLKDQVVNIITGETKSIEGSTRKLSTQEFNEYIERVIQFAAEDLEIQIALPNEQVPMFSEPLLAHYDENEKVTIVT
jgi:hypothetical protein